MQLAIITGASRGIGLAIAKEFQQDGFGVVNLSRSPCPLSDCYHLPMDFTNRELVFTSDFLSMVEKAKRIVLVHNSATMQKDSAVEFDSKALRDSLEVSIAMPSELNKLLIPKMPHGSCVVYIGSTLSHKAVANTYSYCVAKHAVVGMMRATCQDLVGKGIHTFCVCPGFTDTEMLREHLGHDQHLVEAIAKLNGFGRLIEPEEIAKIVKFLSDQPVVNGALFDSHLGQIEA